MSDEQWVWLFVNKLIDTDEKLSSMCPDCREEVTSKNKCTRCGKEYKPLIDIDDDSSFINPNFDTKRYEKLKNG